MTKLFDGQHEHVATTSLVITIVVVLLSQVQVTDARDWYCGSAANTLMNFCQSCYATKRSHSSLPLLKSKSDEMFLTKERASGYLEAKRSRLFSSVNLDRRQHGQTNFVTECCYNPCTRFEMIKYCCTSRQIEFNDTEGKK